MSMVTGFARDLKFPSRTDKWNVRQLLVRRLFVTKFQEHLIRISSVCYPNIQVDIKLGAERQVNISSEITRTELHMLFLPFLRRQFTILFIVFLCLLNLLATSFGLSSKRKAQGAQESYLTVMVAKYSSCKSILTEQSILLSGYASGEMPSA